MLTCRAHSGVCAKCYGMNLATQQARGPGRGRRHHRRPVHRRARYPADHAYLPHRRRGRRRHHPGSSPCGGAVRGPQAQADGHSSPRSAARSRFEEATKGSLLNIIITADDGDTRTYAVPHTGLLVQDGEVIEAGRQLTVRRAESPRRAAHPRRRRRLQLPHPGGPAGLPPAGRGYQR